MLRRTSSSMCLATAFMDFITSGVRHRVILVRRKTLLSPAVFRCFVFSAVQTFCVATLAGPIDCPMQEGATTEALHAICNQDATIFARYAAAANMSTLCHLAGCFSTFLKLTLPNVIVKALHLR